MMRSKLLLTAALAMGALSLTGCPEGEDDKGEAPSTKTTDDGGKTKPTKAGEDKPQPEPDAKVDGGPKIEIPAGKLKAGSRCMDVPRIRPNELEHEDMSMGAFDMDLYPYPNEPGKPAKLGVNWHEAKKLCEERGRRLCTELEWERACKGPKNTTYMWGDGFKKGRCDGQLDHLTNQRADCKTEFAVMDMMGVALEWTASDWERGTRTGDKVVRGARAEKVSWLSARCTHSRKRDPNMTYDNVGFRCCGGEPALPEVELDQRKRSTVVEETDIATDFEMALMKAMPRDHRGIVGVELTFDKVYYWHPVANEEMIVARWKGKPEEGDSFYEIAVFKMCSGRAWKAATMRGPVEKISKPKVGINARKLSFDVKTEDHRGKVSLSYWHGTVKVNQPDWIKKGNQLKVKKGKTKFRLPVMKRK